MNNTQMKCKAILSFLFAAYQKCQQKLKDAEMRRKSVSRKDLAEIARNQQPQLKTQSKVTQEMEKQRIAEAAADKKKAEEENQKEELRQKSLNRMQWKQAEAEKRRQMIAEMKEKKRKEIKFVRGPKN